MKVVKLKSPGKVNFRLDVVKKRSDGYHDLRMLNAAVSIYDEMEIEMIERGIQVDCEDDPNVPSGEANIVYRATKEIMAYSNKNVGIKINIKKRIPSGAGMGGGSSNAAQVLLTLNQILRINLSKEKLIKIGLRFGADIPFFLYGSPAIATGIGENLTKVKKMPKVPLVIVSPNVVVATKSVYERYSVGNGAGNSVEEMEIPKEFTSKKVLVKYMKNDLESVTGKQYPIVNEIKDLLMKHGALAAQMTGSGPTVFGVFSDKETADKAFKKISSKEANWKVFVAETI